MQRISSFFVLLFGKIYIITYPPSDVPSPHPPEARKHGISAEVNAINEVMSAGGGKGSAGSLQRFAVVLLKIKLFEIIP